MCSSMKRTRREESCATGLADMTPSIVSDRRAGCKVFPYDRASHFVRNTLEKPADRLKPVTQGKNRAQRTFLSAHLRSTAAINRVWTSDGMAYSFIPLKTWMVFLVVS